MTKRNEQTGKKVASVAGTALSRIDMAIYGLEYLEQYIEGLMKKDIPELKEMLEGYKSVAASALTQVQDKPKRRK